MVLFSFSRYYIFAVQIAFYFLRFKDKTCPHGTKATHFVGHVSEVMWTTVESIHIFIIFSALINAKV